MTEENDIFVWEDRGDHVKIEKWKDEDKIAEIPSRVNGLPVTELGDYVLSGLACEKVILPKKVKKIGKYGFYNCRNLKELAFSSCFADLGCGAFTGCHKIGRLQVQMEDEENSGLKEILSEIHESLRIELKGKIQAVLWFPEFYEEGVENTPARILMTHVHGSGLYYRNCFQGKKLNFFEYDKRFELALAQESPDFVRELVYGRLSKPWELCADARERYEAYVWEHYEDIALAFVQEDGEEDLEWLLTHYPIAPENKPVFEKILNAGAMREIPSMMSMLMEYARVHFPAKRKSFEL